MTVLQNFYEETITASLSTGTVKMYVSGKPIADATSGWVVINPGNAARREIVAFDAIGTDGSGDFIELSERGVGGTTEQTHEVGEPVRLNITAEHWAALEATVADSIPATYLDTDGTLAADSDTKIPSQKATKTYVDTQDALLVSKEGDQTINGEKTFSESPIVPEPTTDFQAATKKYADDIAVAGAPNAGLTTKGLVQQATDSEIEAGTDVGDTGAKLFVTPSKVPNNNWKASISYDINDVAKYGEDLWIAIIANTDKEPGDSTYQSNLIGSAKKKAGTTANAEEQGCFANGGLYYYSMVDDSAAINRKTLSIPYELESETATVQYNSPITVRGGFFVREDGLRLYICYPSGGEDRIGEYSTTTAYDFSSMTSQGSQEAYSDDFHIHNFSITPDGKYLLTSTIDEQVRYKELSTAWDITTMPSGVGAFLISLSDIRRVNIFDNGKRFFVSSSNNKQIYKFNTQNDASSGVVLEQNSNFTTEAYMLISENGLRLYELDDNSQTQWELAFVQIWNKKGSIGYLESQDITGTVPSPGFLFGSGEGSSKTISVITSTGTVVIPLSYDSGGSNDYNQRYGTFCIPVETGDSWSATGGTEIFFRAIR